MPPKTVTASLPSPDDPEHALAAVVALRLAADKLERAAVLKALEQGWRWADVAEALGVTKQAAHKKHARFVSPAKRNSRGND